MRRVLAARTPGAYGIPADKCHPSKASSAMSHSKEEKRGPRKPAGPCSRRMRRGGPVRKNE